MDTDIPTSFKIAMLAGVILLGLVLLSSSMDFERGKQRFQIKEEARRTAWVKDAAWTDEATLDVVPKTMRASFRGYAKSLCIDYSPPVLDLPQTIRVIRSLGHPNDAPLDVYQCATLHDKQEPHS